MKKIFLSLFILAIVGVTSAVSFAGSPAKMFGNANPSDYEIGIKYEEAIKADKPFVALFYADWCTYCKKFMPKYNILSQLYKDQYNFVMVNVDDASYSKVIKESSLTGFPTLYIYDPTIENRIYINNGTYDDLGKLRVELDRYLRIRSMLDLKK